MDGGLGLFTVGGGWRMIQYRIINGKWHWHNYLPTSLYTIFVTKFQLAFIYIYFILVLLACSFLWWLHDGKPMSRQAAHLFIHSFQFIAIDIVNIIYISTHQHFLTLILFISFGLVPVNDLLPVFNIACLSSYTLHQCIILVFLLVKVTGDPWPPVGLGSGSVHHQWRIVPVV